jgi:hypothetical protein
MESMKFLLAVSVRGKLPAYVPALTLFFSRVYNGIKTPRTLAKLDSCANALVHKLN